MEETLDCRAECMIQLLASHKETHRVVSTPRTPPVFCIKKNIFLFLLFFILILIIISSDFREGNTSLLYTGLMATRALALRVHLLGRNLKKDNITKIYIYFFWGANKIC